LRGRCGRQGDPGSSRFFLSLEDDLMRIFAGEWVKNVLTRLGMKEGEAIESRMVTRRIEAAQKKVEERNFEIRKNLLEYDEVMDEQRKRVYAIASGFSTAWGTNYRDRDLKKIDRDHLAETLIKDANHAIDQVDFETASRYLDPDFGIKTACSWMQDKFTIELDPEEMKNLEPGEFIEQAQRKAQEAYDQRESEYPVLAGLLRFSQRDRSGQRHGFQREELVEWARKRFGVEISLEDLRNKQREEIRQLLLEHSRKNNLLANQIASEAKQKVDALFKEAGDASTLGQATGQNGKLSDLASWLRESCGCEVAGDELARLDREEARRRVIQLVEDKYRPEMRRMERSLLLQILDQGWKEHLLTMDHLRSSVGLRGYAQVDPKVEYKREGMRLFENMWRSVANYVTDLIFKMEQLDEGFVGSTWVESAAIHEEAPPASEIVEQQQAAIDGTEAKQKMEPIRNRAEKTPRNAPCPCGSGKKFKNCCMKTGV
jgi:preprotein translocase subunit SecA